MIRMIVAALIRVDRYLNDLAEERRLISLGAVIAERGRDPQSDEEWRALDAYDTWLLR